MSSVKETLTEAVVEVPGVAHLYPSGLGNVIGHHVRAVLDSPVPAQVEVDDDGAGKVAVTIGVAPGHRAPDVAGDVYRSIMTTIETRWLGWAPDVTVTVSTVGLS